MLPFIRKSFFLTVYIIVLTIIFSYVNKADAASLISISDYISTSRPSASNVLGSNQAANATQISLVDLGQSASSTIFLASDSATFLKDTGETQDSVNVASMSSQISASPNTRNLYFTSVIPHSHHQGDAVIVPIVAMHKIQFTTVTNIPSSGKIVISFPALLSGDASNTASPSASTFELNTLADGSIKLFSGASTVTFTGSYTQASAGVSPSITLGSLGSSIAGGSVVTIYVGCSAATSASCSTQLPTIINPTKSATATTGNADTWKVAIQTQDSSAITLDTGSAKVGTVESVQVQATVEPTLTFTISGVNANTNINTISGSCGSITTTSPGINTSATSVNLGLLTSGAVNTAAQQLQVSTNGSSGYVITATTSGRFINPATGVYITDANDPASAGLTANDTPVPKTIAAGTPAFGVHACGVRSNVNTDQWVNAGTIGTAKFSNPWNNTAGGFYNTIASYSGGAVSNENTAVLYGAAVAGTTPAGVYTTVFTYVATATF